MSQTAPLPARPASWRWWVSGLLLLATMINYMDRQTLANVATRITDEFALSQEQYGNLEFAFGWAFAAGSLAFGILADRLQMRWLYPAILIAWSAVGFLTGLVRDYSGLMICRTLLGFFEAGHWPCALRTTQTLMARGDRMMGNSVLQSGASLGAVLTPLVIRFMLGDDQTPGAWRMPFLVIGAIGMLWAVAWFRLVRNDDLPAPVPPKKEPVRDGAEGAGVAAARWWRELFSNRRFWVLAFMVICINTTWQLVRAWLPKFLQEGRGYSEAAALYFNSAYFIATDVGCILAGLAALWLVRRGVEVHRSRIGVFAVCAAMTALTTAVAALPQGWLLMGMLLVVAAGSLGLFPCYYSFTQELTERHIGKAAGLLATFGWLVSSPFQRYFGRLVDRTGSFDLGIALAGWAPALAFIAMALFWRPRPDDANANSNSNRQPSCSRA